MKRHQSRKNTNLRAVVALNRPKCTGNARTCSPLSTAIVAQRRRQTPHCGPVYAKLRCPVDVRTIGRWDRFSWRVYLNRGRPRRWKYNRHTFHYDTANHKSNIVSLSPQITR